MRLLESYHPVGDRILVSKFQLAEEPQGTDAVAHDVTNSLSDRPVAYVDKLCKGIVVGVGPDSKLKLKKGDTVCFTYGRDVEVDGEKYCILSDYDVVLAGDNN